MKGNRKNTFTPAIFTIFDTGEQATLVKDVLRQLNYRDKQYNPRSILSLISRAKNESISPTEYERTADGYFESIVAKVYPLYQEALRLNNSLDFDDLLLFTVDLLKKEFRDTQVLSKQIRVYSR